MHSRIIVMLIATLGAWFSWLMVVMNISPTIGHWWAFVLFYVTLFLSLFGSFSLLGFAGRSITQFRQMTMQYKASTALRQSFLWSLTVVCALALQGQRILNWWVLALIVAAVIIIEFFFATLQFRSIHE